MEQTQPESVLKKLFVGNFEANLDLITKVKLKRKEPKLKKKYKYHLNCHKIVEGNEGIHKLFHQQ